MSKNIYRNKGSKDNIVISIAGPHGVGKTTIYTLFKKKVGDNAKFKFFPERYRKIPPFPFGSHDKQIAFRSELHFLQQLIRRNRNISNFDVKYNGRIIILDRTPVCVLVYSKSLNLKEKDFNLILDMFNSVKWREDYIIYLTAEPDTILKRIIRRGSLQKIRKEWNEEEKEYLLKIISFYNQFLLQKKEKNKIFIVNTENLTAEEVLKEIEEIIVDLSGYYFKKIVKSPQNQMSIKEFIK
ncbi:MAG: hypothetical protein EU540_04490 [Promethearchaeota archaeon]|nr:MAG: hypothetical protein EU540_04490 [Candidatus Lokiarchaeota archaeon]